MFSNLREGRAEGEEGRVVSAQLWWSCSWDERSIVLRGFQQTCSNKNILLWIPFD